MTLDATLSADFYDLLREFHRVGVRFLVVGAHALSAHGVTRATGDLDVWVEASPENAILVHRALEAFGAPLSAHAITAADFEKQGTVYQMGLPPLRIDVLTQISGVQFSEAWATRTIVKVRDLELPVLGKATLIANKRAAGRPKDLLDVELLEK
ncbi:MAG: hypothetical protein QM817_16015 [Archangium sp.]